MRKPRDAAKRRLAPTPLEMARRYHKAWTHKNFQEAGRYLAAEFLTRLTGFGQFVTRVNLLAECGSPPAAHIADGFSPAPAETDRG